jgi:serine/threonine protein kinase
MNVEAMSGMVLGTCTLEKLIGRGSVGAVFLAQQSRPKRQVAVKVLLPMTTSQPSQHAAFLERFRRETDAAASLGHPHIVPVHEYGERDGLAYLVMAYISGGTLRDELEREGRLPLTQVVSYLEQMASALDFAHQRGVIHRDIKPANILLTPEKRLLLTDFGLVKIVTEGHVSSNPLSEFGMPMGTPDYMSPEQVLGGQAVESRADIYSLGILVYHMVTGTVPFTGDSPIKVALQHLHNSPPSPRIHRPDLPVAAEQVILHAMARLPEKRYPNAREFATAFRQALETAGVMLDPGNSTVIQPSNGERPTANRPRSLFDPVWRNAGQPEITKELEQPKAQNKVQPTVSTLALSPQASHDKAMDDIVTKTSMTLPSFSDILGLRSHQAPSLLAKQSATDVKENQSEQPMLDGSFLSNKTHLLDVDYLKSSSALTSTQAQNKIPQPQPSKAASSPLKAIQLEPSPAKKETVRDFSPSLAQASPVEMEQKISTPNNPSMMPNATASFHGIGAPAPMNSMIPLPESTDTLNKAAPPPGATGALMIPVNESSGQTGMLKLTQPVKVVKVPVAGQPGQYVTGLLPVLPQQTPEPNSLPTQDTPNKGLTQNAKIAIVMLAVLVIILSSGIYLLTRQSSTSSTQVSQNSHATPNAMATAAAIATATAQANIILADALDHNSHNWLVGTYNNHIFGFENGAYHIVNNSSNQLAIALLPDEDVPEPFTYTLTMTEVKGDDLTTAANKLNLFGLVFRYNQKDQNNQAFYCFEVKPTNSNAEYQFRKYDSSQSDPWSVLWHQPLGSEYHTGQGSTNTNTVKVVANGNNFTFVVNGKQVGTSSDNSLQHGQIGMLVNQVGAEIAFSNLLLTHT